MIRLVFEPVIPGAAWIALAVLAVLITFAYAIHRPWGVSRLRWLLLIGLSIVGFSIPLAILLNPVWIEEIPPPAGKPRLTILIDGSESMATSDVPNSSNRFAAARQVADAAAADLAQTFDIELATFAKTTTPIRPDALATFQPQGQETDLAQAINDSVRADQPGRRSILLLSDGRDNASDGDAKVLSAVRLARSLDTPIFTCTFGQETESRDLAVRLLVPEQLSFVKQRVPVHVRVRRHALSLPEVRVVLKQNGNEIAHADVAFSLNNEAEAQFDLREEQTGLYRYEVEVAAVPGEITRANNHAMMVLRVVDKPIRVLLLEGKPYWDGKFLLRTLASDSSLEVDNIVRFTDRRLLKRTLRHEVQPAAKETAEAGPAVAESPPAANQTLPDAAPPSGHMAESWEILTDPHQVLADRDRLRDYQVIVLGRAADVFLDDAAVENLRGWISLDSGALVCYRGQPAAQTPARLRSLLPVDWKQGPESRFRMEFTEHGRSLGWLPQLEGASADRLSDLPSLATMSRIDRAKPLAIVLAGTATGNAQQEHPTALYQSYGAGRVVVIEGAGMWRWAFLSPAYQSHDDVYGALWQSLLRWLVSGSRLLPGQQLALRSDKLTFTVNEDATATLLTREELKTIPTVELSGSSLTGTRSFVPFPRGDEANSYRINFGRLPEGQYTALVNQPDADDASRRLAFDVGRLLDEQLYLEARPDLMARIAASSGGQVLETAGTQAVSHRISSALAQPRAAEVRRQTAWDRWWILAAGLVLWAALWTVRRSTGLI